MGQNLGCHCAEAVRREDLSTQNSDALSGSSALHVGEHIQLREARRHTTNFRLTTLSGLQTEGKDAAKGLFT